MNRQKKKISHSSDEDDQVSIFDSEQEDPKPKKNQKANKTQKKITPANRPNKNKPKRNTAKSREKKLSKEEDDIMKKIMGVKEEEKSRQSTESEKKEEEKIQGSQMFMKKEYTCANHEEWKDDSNPYEEIPLLDQYSVTKDNHTDTTYGNNTQKYVSNSSLGYSNRAIYNKYSNPYMNMQQYPSLYNQQQQYNPYYGDASPYSHANNAYSPNIDPSIELNFEDFQEVNFDDQKNMQMVINLQEIEQLKQEVDMEKKFDINEDNKRDRKFRKRRMTYILAQIERLKKEYIQLENMTADSSQNQPNQIVDDSNLLKEWKYDPELLKKPQKPKLEAHPNPSNEENNPKSKTEGRITMLNQVLTENPFLTQVEMAEVLRAMDPIMNARIQRSVVLRLLKMCGFKKKKVRGICKERNAPLSLSLRCEYAHKYREYASQDFEIFYFDQLIINQYFDKESGWCKAEEEVEFHPQRFIDRSVVVLAMLSSKGTCKWDVRFGNYEPEEYCKSFNNLLKVSEVDLEKRLLVVNPLPYRNPKIIMDILDKRGWEMLVLPSDGLGLNPLQSYFADVRDIMRRKRYDTIQTLFQSVVEVLQDGDKQGLGSKMLSRVETYVEKAMRREML